MIEYAAPGKAVIWGEYAVLQGAPALVMAVNRYASARIAPDPSAWHIISSGYAGDQTLSAAVLATLEPGAAAGAAGVVRAALQAFGDPPIPTGAEVRTDTSEFHADGNKLGIGSSAAVCTATCAAMAELLEEPFTYERALATHQALQGKVGSGLDVAAACQGGLIRFKRGQATPISWPEDLQFRFFWVGHSAKTTDHIARFNDWRSAGPTPELNALCDASERLFEQTDLEGLQAYTNCLKKMDDAADLGIYEAAHRHLDKLAEQAQVVYKPCGAGGGDIGVALSEDAPALESFIKLANQATFQTLDLEIAAHGVHRIRD